MVFQFDTSIACPLNIISTVCPALIQPASDPPPAAGPTLQAGTIAGNPGYMRKDLSGGADFQLAEEFATLFGAAVNISSFNSDDALVQKVGATEHTIIVKRGQKALLYFSPV